MIHEDASSETRLHLLAIRKALARGNAAVMVGSGFSRNAEGGSQLSTWPQLAEELAKALNPSENGRATFSTANVTQLGEQYARVFSTPALEDLIKRMVPDDRVVPGALHTELLSLPWSDIFTTNYDTLLERAADSMIERAHFTVCCREDIPMSKVLGRRRIVKLHGSFPSQRPFIFTEEDYRTYPEKFAPFVNLVRQSLLENVFCLIGFSGDDPNFLHWLGWVRDMLDKHALPVYLFLSAYPNLGQRRLLEARGVTPVLLPTVLGSEPGNYALRFKDLFNELSKPLQDSPMDWGKVALPSDNGHSDDKAENYRRFQEACVRLAAQRKTYPGWLVAPRKIRVSMRHSLPWRTRSLVEPWLRESLRADSIPMAIVLTSLHAWIQMVTLHPLDDRVAVWAIDVLREGRDVKWGAFSESERKSIEPYGIANAGQYEEWWGSLVLSLVRWARQGMRENLFRELCGMLLMRFNDATWVIDELKYEQILLNLHRGERIAALSTVRGWIPKSSDPYQLLRKSALLAECGDLAVALTYCREVIQRLRDSQRLHPNDPLLTSQEAWASLITLRLQQSMWLRPGDEVSLIEGLGERLETLESKGYSPSRELQEAACALEAEAPSPYEAKYKFSAFDLGLRSNTSIERFGWTTELTDKISSSLEWLELADRVCLPYRTTNSIIYASGSLQAAWWAQHAESTDRVLSVFLRCWFKDSLEPRNETKPPHKTGWLSRYQVACLDQAVATDICARLMEELTSTLDGSNDSSLIEAVAPFNIEVASRLVIRVVDHAQVMKWLHQVVRLHTLSTVQSDPTFWTPLAAFLSRLVEALPDERHAEAIRAIAQLSFEPPMQADELRLNGWIKPYELTEDVSRLDWQAQADAWQADVTSSLDRLDPAHQPSRFAWRRALWLHTLGVMDQEQETRLSRALWRSSTAWPTLQDFNVGLAFTLPGPDSVDRSESFLSWLDEKRLSSFSGSSALQLHRPGSRRSWGVPVDETFLQAWRTALASANWDGVRFTGLLAQIRAWWQLEGAEILDTLAQFKMLEGALRSRLRIIDNIFADALRAAPPAEIEDVRSAIADVLHMLPTSDVPMPRCRVALAELATGSSQLREAMRALLKDLTGPFDAKVYPAVEAIHYLIKVQAPGHVITVALGDALAAILLGRRMPVLLWALQLLCECMLSDSMFAIEDRHIDAIDAGLSALRAELKYAGRQPGSEIVDDALPLLRFQCVRLAQRLLQRNIALESARKWVEDAAVDPLPELRFRRYLEPR